MNRRDFIKKMGISTACFISANPFARAAESEKRKLNILFFTADDLHRDSVGCFGGKVPGLTPNLRKIPNI